MASLPEIEQFSHDHVFLGASHDANARRTLWVVLLTAVMMIAEIFAGYWTGSMALLADGLVDCLHLFVYPVALGAGGRLFPEGTPRTSLRLRTTDTYDNGVVHLAYGCAD